MKKSFTDELREVSERTKNEINERRKEILKKDYDKILESFVVIYDEVDEINGKRLFTSLFNFIYYLKGEENELEKIDEKANEIETRIEKIETSLENIKKGLSNLNSNGKIIASLRRYDKERNYREDAREKELDKTLTKALKEKR